MKTLLLASIIAAIGISLTFLVFLYQYQQNCRAEGGSLVEPFTCDKTNYELISESFHKKYTITGGWVADGVNGATTNLTSTDAHGNSITFLLKENQNGPYYVEIVCKHKDSRKMETITENILAYLQNENCLMPPLEETANVESVQRVKTDQYILEILNLQANYLQNGEILFFVHEKGFDIRCFSVYAEIYNSSGNKIWEQPAVEECPPGLGKSDFDHKIPFSGIKIDKAGEYRLVIQSRGYEITRTFSVLDQNLVR